MFIYHIVLTFVEHNVNIEKQRDRFIINYVLAELEQQVCTFLSLAKVELSFSCTCLDPGS